MLEFQFSENEKVRVDFASGFRVACLHVRLSFFAFCFEVLRRPMGAQQGGVDDRAGTPHDQGLLRFISNTVSLFFIDFIFLAIA